MNYDSEDFKEALEKMPSALAGKLFYEWCFQNRKLIKQAIVEMVNR